MDKHLNDPHDRFFRQTFSIAGIARDFLRHNLPRRLLKQLDLRRMAVSKDTYVTKELRTAYSDLVYLIPFTNRGADGEELHVYVLFEHKSAPTRWAGLQLLRYFTLSAEQFRKQRPKTRYLPPVFPLVLYHGAERWSAPLAFHRLVRPLPRALVPYVPRFQYRLIDISRRSSIDIKGEILTRLTLLAMRHIYSDEPVERLRELLELIATVINTESALEILEALLRYYVQATGRVSEEQARELVTSLPQGDKLMQTFIDRYIEQGIQRGIERGIEQGIEQGTEIGRRQGEASILLCQMRHKFGELPRTIVRRIEAADDETILVWSRRILGAQSIEDIFEQKPST